VTGAPPPDSLRRLRKDPLVPAVKAAAGQYDPVLLQTIDWMLEVNEADRPASAAQIAKALEGAGRRRLPVALGSLKTWGLAAGAVGLASMAALAATNFEAISRMACGQAGFFAAARTRRTRRPKSRRPRRPSQLRPSQRRPRWRPLLYPRNRPARSPPPETGDSPLRSPAAIGRDAGVT
jgi:hypothetical protein